jgi:VWFA-related protein
MRRISLLAGIALAVATSADAPVPSTDPLQDDWRVEQFEPLARGLGAGPAFSQDRDTDPVETDVVEKAVVALREFNLLVTDKRGRAITDLRAAEVHVFEGGAEQRVAFLETVFGAREIAADIPPSELLETTIPDQPASPVRRIVLAFDAFNSTLRVRQRWLDAARGWVDDGLRPGDEVGIVSFGNDPKWVLPLTHDVDGIREALDRMELEPEAVDRDMQREMSSFMNDIRSFCPQGKEGFRCAFSLGEEYVGRWNRAAEQSVAQLDEFVEQLASVPGRKAVLLFSEGIIGDASAMAVNALLMNFGTENVNIETSRWRYRADAYDELRTMQTNARNAGVSFFTLYTARATAQGFAGDLEQGEVLTATDLGVNAWSRLESSARETLSVLATETGGRSYERLKDLNDDVRHAADAFLGIYSVGYYRKNPDADPGRLRVKVSRRNVDLDYDRRN